jgi:hypothetical protein
LQLFETKFSPRDAASAPLVEIIRVKVSNSENVEQSLQVWEKASHYLAGNGESTTSITYGKSSNLETDVIMGIIGWQNEKVRFRIQASIRDMLTINRNTMTFPKRRSGRKRWSLSGRWEKCHG